jgi:hypothetical protein
VDIELLVAGHLAATTGERAWLAPPYDSTALSLAIGVDPTDFYRHSALGDVEWCRAMWEAL